MLGDITVAENIYIACSYTDMRKSIDGLAAVVQQQFRLDPFSKSLFLFCGKRRDRIKVLKEEGKKPQTKSYMWLYRTGDDGKPPVILYDYQPSRNGDHAVVFLKDFKGFVHSDGYSGYNKLTGITRCGCWAHLRRKFIEAIPKKTGTDEPLTNAEIGRDYCNQLFEIERDLKHLSPAERRLKRLELEKPILEAFWCWLENLNVLNGSALGKAVTYAKNQKK